MTKSYFLFSHNPIYLLHYCAVREWALLTVKGLTKLVWVLTETVLPAAAVLLQHTSINLGKTSITPNNLVLLLFPLFVLRKIS